MKQIRNKLNEAIDLLFVGGIPIFMLALLITLTIALLYPINYAWLVPYLVFIYFDDIHENGGRRISFFYNGHFYKKIRSYFDIQLVKEGELDPAKNYLFAYHPHGIWGLGCQGTFRSSNSQFAKLFPGIDVTILTLNINFTFPIYREFMLAMGFASVSKRSITHLLTRAPGSSAILVPGGGAEALYASDDRADLVLKKRYGFIKVAIETGAELVPVYGFGETSLFTLWDAKGNHLFDAIQSLCKLAGFRIPLFFGRGFLEGSRGIFPHKKQITVVVGAPIPMTKNPNPTMKEVIQQHEVYCERLKEMYDKYKEQYHVGPLPIPELQLI